MTVATDRKSLAEAARQMIDRLERLSRDRSGRTADPNLIHRLEIEVDQVDPLDWLEAQAGNSKTYWRGRDGDLEMAGLGCAQLITSRETPHFGELTERLAAVLHRQNPDIRYYGGLRFDPSLVAEKRDPRWAAFGSYRFVLHRFELVTENSQQNLVCNLFDRELSGPEIETIIQTVRNLKPHIDRAQEEPPRQAERRDFPDRNRWLQNVRQALTSFKTGESEKLVLARRASMHFATGLSPWQVLHKLRDQSQNCFLFGVQPDDSNAFLGASPERLFRRDHDELLSEAIAGTRPRGADADVDAKLAQELTASEKENWEHELVVTGLRAGLGQVCTEHTKVEGPTSLKLARVQHLVTRFSGKIKPGVNDFQIIGALHPSSAVGGYPVENAPALLQQYEPFDRGWYAGLVGWIGADSTEFAVGIRSALLSGRRLDLFSGAGIVADSQPEAEWDEVESKISQFLHLANGNST